MSEIRVCSKCKQEYMFRKGHGRSKCAECRLAVVRQEFKRHNIWTRNYHRQTQNKILVKTKKLEYEVAILRARLDERDKLRELITEIKEGVRV